jgi:hypothetical protein
MKPRTVATAKKRDVVAELEAKKEKLKELNTERLHATGILNHYNRKSLDDRIHSLEREIVDLTEEAKNENLSFKVTNAVGTFVSNKIFGQKTPDQLLASKVERQNHAEEVKEKNKNKR